MGYTCSSTCQWSQHHSLRGVGRWTWSTINWQFRHHDKWTHATMWVQIAFPNFQGSLTIIINDRTCIQFIRVDAQCFFFKISIRLGVFQNMECQSFKTEHPMFVSFNNMHCCISIFFLPSTCLDDAGWLSPSHSYGQLGDVERSDHHVVGAIHHHVASFQSRPMLRKNWAITLQAWTMMPRNKRVSFFQVVSFFEHGMGFRFTTCTPKIVILRCSCDQIGVSSAIWNDVFPSQHFCSLDHLTLDIVFCA